MENEIVQQCIGLLLFAQNPGSLQSWINDNRDATSQIEKFRAE